VLFYKESQSAVPRLEYKSLQTPFSINSFKAKLTEIRHNRIDPLSPRPLRWASCWWGHTR